MSEELTFHGMVGDAIDQITDDFGEEVFEHLGDKLSEGAMSYFEFVGKLLDR